MLTVGHRGARAAIRSDASSVIGAEAFFFQDDDNEGLAVHGLICHILSDGYYLQRLPVSADDVPIESPHRITYENMHRSHPLDSSSIVNSHDTMILRQLTVILLLVLALRRTYTLDVSHVTTTTMTTGPSADGLKRDM
ncbi:unnamed protein product [Soboliphyme baturini]|uniref:Uncharacterized protein n=1 Tax=Soboliphyme baturini TaxID=241478 RepID=A0A183J210_9BILA|nr:unnamed protein product [Soboliphyme baturini]